MSTPSLREGVDYFNLTERKMNLKTAFISVAMYIYALVLIQPKCWKFYYARSARMRARSYLANSIASRLVQLLLATK
jgi:hypothetical protein